MINIIVIKQILVAYTVTLGIIEILKFLSSNGMCARFVAHANVLSRDLLRDVMSNRHRSRDREERVVYIYLSDLVFFRWTKSYLSHLICHPCATNLSHIQGVPWYHCGLVAWY